MHYYPFDVGDYRKDTAHLTNEEHYAYRAMLDECYLTEKPLPSDKRVIMRKLKLTPGQEWIVDNVLLDFFISTDDGYIHPRVEAEIAEYQERSRQATDAINTRWARVREGKKKVRSNSPRNTDVIRPNNDRTTDVIPTKNQEPRTKKKKGADAPGGNSSSSAPVPYQAIVDLYHKILPMLPRVVKITDKRKSHIRARWNGDAQDLDWWKDYFEFVAASKFLVGQAQPSLGRPVFRADIDFLIREDVMIKTQEGKYHHD